MGVGGMQGYEGAVQSCRLSSAPPRAAFRDSARNAKLCKALLEVIREAGAENGCPRSQGQLLYTCSTKVWAEGALLASLGIASLRAAGRVLFGSLLSNGAR